LTWPPTPPSGHSSSLPFRPEYRGLLSVHANVLGHPAVSKARRGARLIRFVRRALRAFMRPWLEVQTRFNDSVIDVLESLHAALRHEIDAVHQRVAQLKALPSLSPHRDRWPVIREGVLAARRQRRVKQVRWAALALAASVATVIAVRGVEDRRLAAANTGDVQQLVSQSQQLEQTLRDLEPQGRVLNGAAASAVADLEDRIAAVDARLGSGAPSASREEMADLWRRRVDLMQGLVNVHVTRAAYLGM